MELMVWLSLAVSASRGAISSQDFFWAFRLAILISMFSKRGQLANYRCQVPPLCSAKCSQKGCWLV